jgi:nucleoside-diphosphate-sugar epimerase
MHGDGDNGFIPTAIGFARQKGAAAYVGDGANRWPAVHRDDAARLFRLALESAPAGSVLHAVGDEGVPIRKVAEIFAAHLNVPRSPSPPSRPKNMSASSAASGDTTVPPRRRSRASCSAGGRPARG